MRLGKQDNTFLIASWGVVFVVVVVWLLLENFASVPDAPGAR